MAALGRFLSLLPAKFPQYSQPRRGKSRNKVAVGEPAAGSFSIQILPQARGLLEDRPINKKPLPIEKKSKEAFSGLSPSFFFPGQRSAMDNWVRCSMKDAAKCVNCHDLQIPES